MNSRAFRGSIIALAALGLAGCQHAAQPAAAPGVAAGCSPASSLASTPGKLWLAEQGWRFATREEAAAAYRKLVDQALPWPDWYTPQQVTLAPGTRFQMAFGSSQKSTEPGAFGTFDLIDEVSDVREGLAVREEWKPDIARIVTYEVTAPLPARVGPVGAQVDPRSCRLLWGRLSQLEMTVPPGERMKYLKVIEERAIAPD